MANQPPPSKPKKRRRDRGDERHRVGQGQQVLRRHALARLQRATASANRPHASAARPRPKSRTTSTSSTTRSRPASARQPRTPSSSASRTGSTRSSETRTRWPPSPARPRTGSIRRSARPSSRTSRRPTPTSSSRNSAESLGKRSLVMIKSTLRRSIRRAQVHNLIGRNVVELIDLPAGQPGHPSRAMTEDQAAKVLKTASGKATGYVRVVKASKGRYGATHAATETGELACGTKPHPRTRRSRR